MFWVFVNNRRRISRFEPLVFFLLSKWPPYQWAEMVNIMKGRCSYWINSHLYIVCHLIFTRNQRRCHQSFIIIRINLAFFPPSKVRPMQRRVAVEVTHPWINCFCCLVHKPCRMFLSDRGARTFWIFSDWLMLERSICREPVSCHSDPDSKRWLSLGCDFHRSGNVNKQLRWCDAERMDTCLDRHRIRNGLLRTQCLLQHRCSVFKQNLFTSWTSASGTISFCLIVFD